MVATVQIIEKNGATGTPTVKSGGGTIRFKNADNATVDLLNPMTVPTAGTDWSFEKWSRFRVTVAPDTNISNIQAYTDGASGFGAGITTYYKTVTTYATPAEAAGSTGYTDLFTATSGSPVNVGTGTYTGTGEKGDHLVMMMGVGTTAVSGTKTAETLTFSYDEI